MSILLDPSDVAELTRRKTKSGQVAQLRSMGLLLHINARNYPVAPKSAIDKSPPDVNVSSWPPNVIDHGQKAKQEPPKGHASPASRAESLVLPRHWRKSMQKNPAL